MMRAARALTIGLRAAWIAPSVIGHSLGSLLAIPPGAPSLGGVTDAPDARLSVRVSHAALARLARVRPSRWRNTCLYRSVAECLVLRAVGLPARIVIGVGASAVDAGVIAHAWVECAGVDCLSTRGLAELETFASPAV